MKRKAAEEVGESPATKKQVTSSQLAQRDLKSCFREGLFELEDQKRQYAQSQP